MEQTVQCNDGTKDVANGDKAPCDGHGGVKPQQGIDLVQNLTDTQKWLLLLGVTALGWFIAIKIDRQKL